MPTFSVAGGSDDSNKRLAAKLEAMTGFPFVAGTESKVIWLNLKSHDPRKEPALALIRAAAGVKTSRVTLCKVSKDGTLVQGYVHVSPDERRTVTVSFPGGEVRS